MNLEALIPVDTVDGSAYYGGNPNCFLSAVQFAALCCLCPPIEGA